MDVKLINKGDTGVLLLSGRIDAKNAEDIGNLFLQMADRFRNIVLDMKELKYISSAGLRALKKLYVKVRNNGGELRVADPAPYVAEVFEMTGFSEMLNIG